MITEDYCSFEIAKMLKDKGFDEPCTELNKLCLRDGEKPVLKVTYQKAMKWLRKEHNKHAQIEYNLYLSWYYDIIDLKETDFHDYDDTKHWHYKCDFKSYEEAVEAALKYVLENLI